VLHRNEKTVKQEGVVPGEIQIPMGCLLVHGESRYPDRKNSGMPGCRWVSSDRSLADPSYRQWPLARHDEIADRQVLDGYVAIRRQNERPSAEAMVTGSMVVMIIVIPGK
jgi:hypothetical protein